MRFPLFIARRYLISRKSHNLINLITGISLLATAAVSMAMVIILSAFNGLEGLVLSMFNTFNPDIRITATVGKVFEPDSSWEQRMLAIPGVVHYAEVLEDNALFRYRSEQHIGIVKGVTRDYLRACGLEEAIFQGEERIPDSGSFILLGGGIDYQLAYSLTDEVNPLSIYVPDRLARPGINPMGYFKSKYVQGTAVFSIQPEIDNRYVLVPLDLARDLFDRPVEVSAIEILLEEGASVKQAKRAIGEITEPGFLVENRYQQQAFLYKVMRSEKWAIFLILSFILLIATFNLIGSVTMLILDKKQDTQVLYSMGAPTRDIRRIFLSEGLLIALAGTFGGILLGIIVVLVQQQFGLIRLSGETTILIEAYPVKLKIPDIVYVLLTVAGIGAIASWLPVMRLRKGSAATSFRKEV